MRSKFMPVNFRECFENAFRRLSKCSQTPPGNVPGRTRKTLPIDGPEAPGKESENDHFEE